jgi:exosortase F-associated protein
MTENFRQNPEASLRLRWIIGVISVIGLLLIFLFQQFDWSAWLGIGELTKIQKFLVNRSFRFVINDIFAGLLVFSLFGKRNLTLIAVYVQVLGFIALLLPYVALKLYYPAYNGPMISFLHRLILNPLLIYLLIFFFWYQEKNKSGVNR